MQGVGTMTSASPTLSVLCRSQRLSVPVELKDDILGHKICMFKVTC